MSFSLRQIRYFHATAETGQVSRAAIELNVSQSAVTTAIRQLEEIVGLTLFNRRSNGVSLTRDGEQFLRHARAIITSVDEAMRVPARSDQRVNGTVRLGVTYTVAGYFLAPFLLRFQRAYPDISVVLEEGSRRAIERGVADGPFDLALTMMQGPRRREDITVSTLHRSARRLWLGNGHPLLALDKVSVADVAKEPYIALTVDDAWEFAQRYWDPMPWRPRVVFKTASVEAIRTMVAAGMGISILSDMIYRPWSLEGQRIETRDLDTPIPTVDVGILARFGKRMPPAVRTLSTFLRKACSGPGTIT